MSVLGSLLAPTFGDSRHVVLFFALCMFLIGCMLYLAIITLIFYRLTFIRLTPQTMAPPYWINMGAVAITTLAGATLLLHVGEWPFQLFTALRLPFMLVVPRGFIFVALIVWTGTFVGLLLSLYRAWATRAELPAAAAATDAGPQFPA